MLNGDAVDDDSERISFVGILTLSIHDIQKVSLSHHQFFLLFHDKEGYRDDAQLSSL